MKTRSSRSRAHQPSLGTWQSIGSPVIAELAAESGFGWLLFDLEHGCGTEASLLGNLQAIKGTPARGIVRVGAPHPELIARVLDWGADGIMVPHVESADAAEACVQAMRYPPRGRRGVSKTVRAYQYGLRPPVSTTPAPLLMVQIETVAGVDHAAAIAKVDGVDVLFVGPGDLSFDLEARPGKSRHTYDASLAEVVRAAKASGKEAGILLRDRAAVEKHHRLGFTHIAVDSDLAILRNGYRHLLEPFRSSPAGDKS